ncbi:hypothetical protein F441_10412 [Phytophthora nicotianae CJ01A1]|uniref:Uncharacterized protein n=2 Tax=Phytophthora nicotianae TaxID=4792 RepID=V9F2B2_PHYNI|nr:hypothetical protein F443_10470 [Phytophthora nicotianae P1569]ETP14666.1 hypothetical protein F441_10412 [Phytophthora nicotianae CJ01A1]
MKPDIGPSPREQRRVRFKVAVNEQEANAKVEGISK